MVDECRVTGLPNVFCKKCKFDKKSIDFLQKCLLRCNFRQLSPPPTHFFCSTSYRNDSFQQKKSHSVSLLARTTVQKGVEPTLSLNSSSPLVQDDYSIAIQMNSCIAGSGLAGTS